MTQRPLVEGTEIAPAGKDSIPFLLWQLLGILREEGVEGEKREKKAKKGKKCIAFERLSG